MDGAVFFLDCGPLEVGSRTIVLDWRKTWGDCRVGRKIRKFACQNSRYFASIDTHFIYCISTLGRSEEVF